MKRKWLFVTIFTLILSSISIFSLPQWVSSYGVITPYSNNRYITGFGISEASITKSEALEKARLQAAEDLIRKIAVEIRSSIALSITDQETNSASRLDSVSVSESQLKLEGIDYEIASDDDYFYALAYIPKTDIADIYRRTAENVGQRIIISYETAASHRENGQNSLAYQELVRLLPFLDQFEEACSIYKVVADRDLLGEMDFPLAYDRLQLSEFVSRVHKSIDDLSGSRATTVDDAVRRMVMHLSQQGVSARSFKTAPLTYQGTDFSSQFGLYIANRLNTALSSSLIGTSSPATVRGSYWENGDLIECAVQVQSESDGMILGSTYMAVPLNALPDRYSIRPGNHDEAIKDLLQLSEGALTDGGLNIQAWTNKGKSADTLVFTEGEAVDLYIKVNQPAFVQITYTLATGEKVLLEEAFYIGLSDVNRVVKYPQRFEVVPPFGVERLILCAFSKEPPHPGTVPKVIDGEIYQVFESAAKVVASARGLRLKAESGEIRTGEAILALTTVPE